MIRTLSGSASSSAGVIFSEPQIIIASMPCAARTSSSGDMIRSDGFRVAS